MSEDIELVELESVPSPIIAGMIVQALRSADIPAFVKGSPLTNEYAIAHKFLGISEVTIQVPREKLQEARKIRALMREGGKTLEEGDEP